MDENARSLRFDDKRVNRRKFTRKVWEDSSGQVQKRIRRIRRRSTVEAGVCGSWLACDGIASARLVDRVVRIAGKPAPTGGGVHS